MRGRVDPAAENGWKSRPLWSPRREPKPRRNPFITVATGLNTTTCLQDVPFSSDTKARNPGLTPELLQSGQLQKRHCLLELLFVPLPACDNQCPPKVETPRSTRWVSPTSQRSNTPILPSEQYVVTVGREAHRSDLVAGRLDDTLQTVFALQSDTIVVPSDDKQLERRLVLLETADCRAQRSVKFVAIIRRPTTGSRP